MKISRSHPTIHLLGWHAVAWWCDANLSIIVIPYDHIRTYDFMLYRTAGGAPLIEKLGDLLAAKGLAWITTIIMIIVYFALFAMIIYVTLGIKILIKIIKGKNITNKEAVNEEPQIENNEN